MKPVKKIVTAISLLVTAGCGTSTVTSLATHPLPAPLTASCHPLLTRTQALNTLRAANRYLVTEISTRTDNLREDALIIKAFNTVSCGGNSGIIRVIADGELTIVLRDMTEGNWAQAAADDTRVTSELNNKKHS